MVTAPGRKQQLEVTRPVRPYQSFDDRENNEVSNRPPVFRLPTEDHTIFWSMEAELNGLISLSTFHWIRR